MAKKQGNARKRVIMFWLIVLLLVNVALAAELLGKGKKTEDSAKLRDGGTEKGAGGRESGDEKDARPDGGQGTGGGQESAGNVPSGSDTPATSPAPDTSKDSVEQYAADLLADMTLEEKVAQMFMVTPEALTGYTEMTAAGEATKESFRKYPVGGIIYMANNLINPQQTRAMLSDMADCSMELIGLPVFLGVDEEGGTVARIAKNEAFGIKNIRNMSEIGASGGDAKAYEAGCILGGYLAELGFNLDFAPVADVWANPENTVVKYRSFGSDALLVRDMVTAQVRGLGEQGILSVVKHFPGHGSTAGDSHKGAAVVDKTWQELRECDLIPFAGAVAEGVPFVMVGHLSLPQVAGGDVPAVLSKEVIEGILREELGFGGVVITDALNMNAITDYYSPAEAAVMALEAGADMLLMPEDFVAAYQGVLDAVADGRLTKERIDASVMRILKVKVEMGAR